VAAACSGKLTENWRARRKSYTEEADELPPSWQKVRFGDLIEELRNGISTRPNLAGPGTPILRISATRSGAVDLSDHRFLPDADDLHGLYGLRDGDLLFTRYNGSLDLLGVCGMVRELGSRHLLYPDKLMRVRIDRRLATPEYIEIFFQAPAARDAITALAKSSAGQQGISGANLREQLVLLPSIEEQHEITRRVVQLLHLADGAEADVNRAGNLADGLGRSVLAKAFRGELVPTEAELARSQGREYETAEHLLLRVRTVATAEDDKKPHAKRRGPTQRRSERRA
jgi:type I restriction enzyme, S subunit